MVHQTKNRILKNDRERDILINAIYIQWNENQYVQFMRCIFIQSLLKIIPASCDWRKQTIIWPYNKRRFYFRIIKCTCLKEFVVKITFLTTFTSTHYIFKIWQIVQFTFFWRCDIRIESVYKQTGNIF